MFKPSNEVVLALIKTLGEIAITMIKNNRK